MLNPLSDFVLMLSIFIEAGIRPTTTATGAYPRCSCRFADLHFHIFVDLDCQAGPGSH